MLILEDERTIDSIVKCENCGQERRGRPIITFDWITRKSRGWVSICFDCFGPRIKWKANEKSKTFLSPAPAEE